ncbi:lycopene cyclase domain-containing protein [Acidianus manzaensis]|uniref:Lycopene cyclase n=1 Tax=Acidianus manzaensis TaxID=282676 RepID=A0A1W6JZG5_9CREN|nr:lycopene cyclase domain-containing protein [Acidianus manzaensis]ARM75584.1 lycopene cyclase [Acidianus manzaensis]
MEIPFLFPRYAYLEIDSLIFFPTLIISLLFLRGKRDYKALIKSILIVSPLYLAWDFIATWKDSWSFNPKYVLGLYVIDLPIEEVIFFFVTPFATLLIYDFLKSYSLKLNNHVNVTRKYKQIIFLISIILIALGIIILPNYSYMGMDLIYLSASLLTSLVVYSKLLLSKIFWEFILLSYIPFFVFDFFLTSLPIVIYGDKSIIGIRVITIPIEDFIYSFSMLTFYITFYEHFRNCNNYENSN